MGQKKPMSHTCGKPCDGPKIEASNNLRQFVRKAYKEGQRDPSEILDGFNIDSFSLGI